MTVTSEQANLEVSKDAKILQVYGEDEFCTIVNDGLVYLLKTTQLSRYNVIAALDVSGNCTIYDRDRANLFVDYTGLHRNSIEIDKLDECQIVAYLKEYLQPDVDSLIAFTDESTALFNFIDKFEITARTKILSALAKAGVLSQGMLTTTVALAKSAGQMEKLEKDLYTFAKLDNLNNKYDICQRTDEGKYIVLAKTGSVGNYRKMSAHQDYIMFVAFNQLPKAKENFSKIKEIVLKDLEDSSYNVANKFIKIQQELDDALDNEKQRILAKSIILDLSGIYHADLEVYAEEIAKLIRTYKKLTALDNKEELIEHLTKIYSDAFVEIEKAKASLKFLMSK